MKKIIFIFFLIIFLTFSHSVSAHVLETNGSIGALLHIEPDDDPIAGQPSSLLFVLKDRQNKLSLDQCLCTVTISQNGKLIASGDITKNNATTASFTFTFPDINIYQIKLIGQPKNKNSFQSFVLTYDIRVAKKANDSKTNNMIVNNTLLVLTFVAIILIIPTLLVMQKKYKKKVKS